MSQPMYGRCLRLALALLSTSICTVALPAGAQAHVGSTAPVASDYLATLQTVPAGLRATVVDGDLRMWLSAPANATVVVLDYRGAPYLRFDQAGVQVNHNSEMYYLNQTPTPWTPPSSLTASTHPDWQPASSAHTYTWHDGRLHALAAVALSPGTRFVGRWTIPVTIDGRRTALAGILLHADRPPLVWFWPIVVLLACSVAASRLRCPRLDAELVRSLGVAALAALAVTAVGRELHGHPKVSPTQTVELVLILAFVAWGLYRMVAGPRGVFTYFVISLAVLWQGLSMIAVLRDGFVLIDLPAFVARTATMLCLACGAAIFLLVFRDADPRR